MISSLSGCWICNVGSVWWPVSGLFDRDPFKQRKSQTYSCVCYPINQVSCCSFSLSLPPSLVLFQSILKCRVEAVMVSVDAKCESVHIYIHIVYREISLHALFCAHCANDWVHTSSQSAALLCLNSASFQNKQKQKNGHVINFSLPKLLTYLLLHLMSGLKCELVILRCCVLVVCFIFIFIFFHISLNPVLEHPSKMWPRCLKLFSPKVPKLLSY